MKQLTTTEHTTIAGISVILTRKMMRSIRMRVKRPSGEVHISAPHRMSRAFIEGFVEARVEWIEAAQSRLDALKYLAPPEYVDGEKIYYMGESYTLRTVAGKNGVTLHDDTMIVSLSGVKTSDRIERVIESWYREELKKKIEDYILTWSPILGVRVKDYSVKKMKTRWGTCSIGPARIWLALSLARHPAHHLEYVVVHEMTHLLEKGHGPRFQNLMTRWLPDWRQTKKEMNEG